MILDLLSGDIVLGTDVAQGFGGLVGIVRQTQQHSAEGFAVDVPGVGAQDIHLYTAIDGQGGDERLVGGAAVEGHPDGPGPGGILLHTDAAGIHQAAGRVGGGVGEDVLHASLLGCGAAIQDGDTGADLFDNAHLVAFTKDGLVSNNTLDYLKSLREYCDVIVYVADSKALPLTVEKLKKLCDCVIVKRHKEYDFGSYKRGYQYLSDSHLLEKIDSLLICNDSVDFVGNSEDLKEIFTKAKADDAYALCMATYGFGKKIKKHRYEWAKNPHLQSYFMVLDKKVFTAEYFKKFMSGIKRIKSKTEIIKKYEMGLSEMLRENNVKMGSFYPYDDTNIVNPYAIYLNQFVKRSVFVKHMLSK